MKSGTNNQPSPSKAVLPFGQQRGSSRPAGAGARKPANLHRCLIGTPWDTAPVDYARSADLWPPRHLEVRDRDFKSIIAGIVCGLLFVMTIWVLS